VRLGIADEIGTETDAIEKAASLAKVANYKDADLYGLSVLAASSAYPFFFQSPDGMMMPYPNEAGTYLLYIPPLPVK
jgi:ClpP class serine protease